MGKIFGTASKYTEPDDLEAEFRTLDSITATCYHWRAVALDTPALWTRIIIKPDKFDPRTHAYLVRAKDAQLRLTIKIYNHFMQWSAQRFQSWMQSLAPHLKRCVSLYLEVPDYEVIRSMLPLTHPMPLLDEVAWLGGLPSLYGETDDPPPNQEPLALYDPAKCSPRSIRISLIGRALPVLWDDAILLKLNTLVLENMAARPTRDVIELIARCTNLTRLRWKQRISEDEVVTEPLPPFISKSIEILDIDVPEVSDPERSVLWRMELPNLRYLCIASRASDIQWAETSLGTSSRFPRLTSLWLSKRVFSAEAMTAFLHAHPTIEEFGCGGGPQTGTLLSLLTQPQPQPQPEIHPSEPLPELQPESSTTEESSANTQPPQLHTTPVHPNLKFLYLLNAAKVHDLGRLCDSVRSLFQRMDHRNDSFSHKSASTPSVSASDSTSAMVADVATGSPGVMTIQLNDESWNTRHHLIPASLTEVEREYGRRRLVLSWGEDSVPWRFRPIGRVALSP
ncbi:uncharacterized protein EI90DRAFT_2974822 [Cantharellus anzutake]|uniref:uncharacterized protein n=1 Tax=Cantharellus anzutake TaxID=1750568 RepID=UPI0019069A38|nr:uncharacterized protein EI90DRAFT_2974822 [Cantharellus anzutake]KAF8327916.1 hypothetical protein EI90DRAFT_2974822 [Cantharellus anzutake]